MSDLLKRADLAQTNTKLVGELADRIRYLEAPTLHKRIAVGFFQWWWNMGGTNTNQGFDTYYEKLLMNELELPSEGAVESRKTGEEIVANLEPVPPEAVPQIHKDITNDYGRKRITLENLQKDWLSGTTCHRQKLTVHWVSDDDQWIVRKHHGHSEWVGGWDGNGYCATCYAMFRVGE